MLERLVTSVFLGLIATGFWVPKLGIAYLTVATGDLRWLPLFILDLWADRATWSILKKITESAKTKLSDPDSVSISEDIVPVLKRGRR